VNAKQKLFIFGVSGLAKEVIDLVEEYNKFDVAGILDDDIQTHGTIFHGHKVFGPIEMASELTGSLFLICIASLKSSVDRSKIAKSHNIPTERFATIIHPAAKVSRSSTIEPGSIVLANSTITANSRLGRFSIVMPSVVITHDDHVGESCTFASGSTVAGYVKIGDSVYVGTGANILERVEIGTGAIIGAGSLINRNVPENETWAGIPARRIS
jgi:sugar O-acyltransferase (sialic acid O-acetyltransferase NeuD family)